MTPGLMRRLFSSSCRARFPPQPTASHSAATRLYGLKQYQRSLTDSRLRQAAVSRAWFTSSLACQGSGSDQPPNERKIKLGKVIRTLHERLPTLLVSPLPQDILSPQISLHLFPSTHPHLPTVSGKLAYTAALWTAPVAWGRVPVVGNVSLKILSERMEKSNGAASSCEAGSEKLIVKWETCGRSTDKAKSNGQVSDAVEKITSIVGGSRHPNEKFSGLFLFEFDEEGRVARHTIEHMEENGKTDRPTKVISVTDWLLGRAWGRREEATPGLVFVKTNDGRGIRRTKER